MTVLVVDDEALLRWSIAEVLRRSGHVVVEATSRETALDAMRHGPIDVVLLDLHLPDANDLRLLEDVRRRLNFVERTAKYFADDRDISRLDQ